MAELPFPSFETLAKVSGWIREQAAIWLAVVRNPLSFLSGVDMYSNAALGQSTGFLAFVLAANAIIKVPFDALEMHFNVLDVTYQLSDFVLTAISILIFSYSIFFFGKMLRGKGTPVAVMNSMLFAAAFYPLFNALGNIAGATSGDYYKQLLQTVANHGVLVAPTQHPVAAIAYGFIMLPIVIWIISKLVPIVKSVHKIGSFRALIVLSLAGVAEQIYEGLVWIPLIMGLSKGTN